MPIIFMTDSLTNHQLSTDKVSILHCKGAVVQVPYKSSSYNDNLMHKSRRATISQMAKIKSCNYFDFQLIVKAINHLQLAAVCTQNRQQGIT